MSQRHKRARRAASTQTEYAGSAGNSPLLSTSLRSFSEGGAEKERTESLDSDVLLLSEGRSEGRSQLNSLDEGRSQLNSLDEGRSQLNSVDYSEFYEDPAVLYERMSKAEEVGGRSR